MSDTDTITIARFDILRAANTLSFAVYLATNIFVTATSPWYGWLAGVLVQIWPLASLLALGYVANHFTGGEHAQSKLVGHRFSALMLLSAAHTFTFGRDIVVAPFILALATLAVALNIYLTLAQYRHTQDNQPSLKEVVLVYMPFSVLLAWSVLATGLSGLFSLGIHFYENTAPLISVYTLLTLVGFAFAMQHKRGDVTGAAIIAWWLTVVWAGGFMTRVDRLWITNLVLVFLSWLAVAKCAYFTYVERKQGSIALPEGGGEAEREPLLPAA